MVKHLSLAAAAAFLAASGTVAGQSAPAWPIKPVTIVVGVQPGAATDIEARLYAQKLTENTGRTVIVDYKPGAGSTIGTHYVVKSCLLYTSPSPRDRQKSRMPSSA